MGEQLSTDIDSCLDSESRFQHYSHLVSELFAVWIAWCKMGSWVVPLDSSCIHVSYLVVNVPWVM